MCSTVIGLKCKDGVVLVSVFLFAAGRYALLSAIYVQKEYHFHRTFQAVEKLVISKLLIEGSNKRIYHVDRHAGAVSISETDFR
jgi:20S proteasome alpha/beta subunit